MKYAKPAFNILVAAWLVVTAAHSGLLVYGSFTDHTEVYDAGKKSCLVVVRSGDLDVACFDPQESN